MNFWWATQTSNYPEAIAAGTLWTCPRAYGQPLKESRRLIKELRSGDIVFHYQKGYLRAVSTVLEEWRNFPRPPEYTRRPGEGDDGWLVTVEPLVTNLALSFHRVGELIRKGASGPLGANGIPAQKYLSPLSDEEGKGLLSELNVAPPEEDGSLLGRPGDSWDGGETDGEALNKIRLEQSALRRKLLRGRAVASCSLCGNTFPSRLLIAGHIKPRSKCTEDERRDYRSAMLICNLGCDALFEWGYIVVNEEGLISASLRAETKELQAAVTALIGRKCTAYDRNTAGKFADHARLVSLR
ncbi:hypothetical protein ACIQF8_01540 [Pseudarthrobacter sp. NPDC092184]|uniref:hypothetical protein n=1 Tax=unclassified Pseudarthrobacter TaxID=2647000 RepID=UPI00382FD7E9